MRREYGDTQSSNGFRHRLAHDGQNLAVGALNAVVSGLLFAGAFTAVDS